MIEQKHIIDLFTRLGHAAGALMSQATGQAFTMSDPRVNILTRAELLAMDPAPACLACTPVESPRPGALLLAFTAPLDTLLPELFINPEALAPPPRFTQLHKGAVTELMAMFWGEAAPLLGRQLGVPLTVRNPVVAHQPVPDFVAEMPLFTGLDTFIAASHTLSWQGGVHGDFLQIYPAVFFRELMMPPAEIPAPPALRARPAEALQAIPLERVNPDSVKNKPARPAANPRAPRRAFSGDNLKALLDIPVRVTVELGRATMPGLDILNLKPGSVVSTGHSVDTPVAVLMNGVVVARGMVVTVGEKFGLQITEIASSQTRLEALE